MNPIRYSSSLFTAYRKGEIRGDRNFIYFETPYIFLTFFPLKFRKRQVPVSQISSVSTCHETSGWQFLIGFAFIIFGMIIMEANKPPAVSLILSRGLFLIFGLIGISFLVNSYRPCLVVTMSSGQQLFLPFSELERAKVLLAEQEINAVIREYLDTMNVQDQTDRILDAINRK